MDWRIIAFGTRILGRFLFTSKMSCFLQQHIMHSATKKPSHIDSGIREMMLVINKFKKYSNSSISDAVVLEIGAGKDLFRNILLYSLGFNKQILFDIHRLIQPKLVNNVISLLKDVKRDEFIRNPLNTINKDIETDLKKYYGISYIAPCEIFSHNIPEESVDLIETRSTLEHIPLQDLQKNIKVFQKVLRNDGIMIHYIDYTDHFYLYDPTISSYNFLKYNPKNWDIYNCKYHYLNRLRHKDYEEIFTNNGFKIIESHAFIPRNANKELGRIEISPHFQSYNTKDLLTARGLFVVKKSITKDSEQSQCNTNFHYHIDSFIETVNVV